MAAILLVTTGCALIEKDEAVDRATPIVTVYESVYTKGQVQDAVQSNLNYMAMMYYYYLGTNYDVKDPANIASTQESVINGFVEEGVKLHFAKEKGITAEK